MRTERLLAHRDDEHRDTLLHELANRAAPLLALAERLRELPLPEEHRAVLSALYRSSRDVDRLVRSLRDPEDFFVPQRVEIDAHTLCADVADGMRSLAREHRMRILVDVGSPARVFADEVQVSEILTNLVKNAIEAGAQGGRVVITVRPRGRVVRLCVRDDGPGLSASLAGRLFQRGASTKGALGRGIGLALSKQLARAQGGHLLHRRVRDAGGADLTEFTLLLRAARGEARIGAALPVDAPALATLAVAANDQSPALPLVLIVEDDPEVRFALEMVLRGTFAVIAAGDGEAALVALRAHRFDAMLTDDNLPRGLGGEALAEAACLIQPDLFGRVLVVSGEARTTVHSPVVARRIRKPFDGPSLRRVLAERIAAPLPISSIRRAYTAPPVQREGATR